MRLFLDQAVDSSYYYMWISIAWKSAYLIHRNGPIDSFDPIVGDVSAYVKDML